jgi:uncharacterized BrkB/YihY/UPF0761 family membrane protein
MENRERAVLATTTLISSLAFYWFARAKGKPETPYVMLGGFVGAIVAELIIIETAKTDQQ